MSTLKTYIKRTPLLDNDRLVTLFEQMAEFVFRELDHPEDVPLLLPSTILVDDEGRPTGVKGVREAKNPHYRAPEVIRGQERCFQSVIYNLGAIFYFMATKNNPFGVYHAGVSTDAHLERILIEPHKLNSELSLELSALIRKMLSFNPATRHKAVASFDLDMQHIKRGEWPVNAPVALAVEDANPPARSTGASPRGQMQQSGQERKRVAVSNKKMSEVRRKRKSLQRRSGNGFVYLILMAAAIWAAWYFNVDQHLGGMDSIKNLFEKVQSVAFPNTPSVRQPASTSVAEDSERDAEVGTAAYTADSQDLESKYDSQRQRYLRNRQSSNTERSGSRSRGGTWQDSEFLAAARLYNDAIDRIEQYSESVQRGRPNPRLLDGVESKIQSAVSRFKSCRARAPADVPIQKYIDNCYKLIAKTRQAKLLDLSN